MSFIGVNIKKIRAVKGLSQSEFADLFGLKRSAVGAYEEGRALPRIDLIIKIAKYFGISVDDLVNRRLRVNDLTGLRLYANKTFGNVTIPLISKSELLSLKLTSDRFIELPISDTHQNLYSFFADGVSFLNAGFILSANDIIICMKIDVNDIDELFTIRTYLFLVGNNIIVSKIADITDKFIFLDNYNDKVEIEKKSIIYIFEIKQVLFNLPSDFLLFKGSEK